MLRLVDRSIAYNNYVHMCICACTEGVYHRNSLSSQFVATAAISVAMSNMGVKAPPSLRVPRRAPTMPLKRQPSR